MPAQAIAQGCRTGLRAISLLEWRQLNRLLAQGRWSEVVSAGTRLLANPEIAPPFRARLHNLICQAYSGQGEQWLDAVLHGQRAVRMARRLRDRELLGEALAHFVRARQSYLAARQLTGAQEADLLPSK